jgi:hypothetical protein
LLKNVSLGGLTMLVLLRAVQVNLSNHKVISWSTFIYFYIFIIYQHFHH